MSYILDALKKADQERTLGDVPDLEAAHWGVRRRKRSYRWVWVLGALLLINGALLVILLGRDDPVISGRDILPGQQESRPVTPVPRAEQVVTPPPREIVRPREPVYVPPRLPAKRQATIARQPPARAPVIQEEAVVMQPSPAVTTPSAAFVPPPAPVPAPVTASAVPVWNDLPLDFRSRFTLPRIDVHVYSDDPGRRFILVDLQKFREGETLDSGAVLEEILPDSIQLYYQDTRFRVEK
jgi:general secretion pathway protein B